MSRSAILDRTMSSYPDLSVGTALAMESIRLGPRDPIDVNRIPPAQVKMERYDEMWVSVQCLLRNLVNAVDRVHYGSLRDEDVGSALRDEVDVLGEAIREVSRGKTQLVPYTRGYREVPLKHPTALLRKGENGTPDQQWFHQRLVRGVEAYYRSGGKGKHHDSDGPSSPGAKVLVLTSHSYDLLQSRMTRNLELLESHTGLLKGKPLWYTKFNDPKGLERIPFNELTLQVFGDRNMFFMQKKFVRDAVREIAERSQWTALTTKDRVRLGFDLCDNAVVREILKGVK